MQVDLGELKGKVDFALVTIREDECNAVLDRFPTERSAIGQRRYDVGALTSDSGRKLTFVVARCIKQGEGEAQRLTDYLIQDLDPALIVLVGIGGAVPSADFTLGDVVCATHVHDFSVRAASEGGRGTFNVGGGEMHHSILSLLGSLPQILRTLPGWNTPEAIGRDAPPVEVPTPATTSRVYGSLDWRKNVCESLTRHFPEGRPARLPIATARAVASSDALIKDTTTLQTWLTDARALAAVEMELAGVYLAARKPQKEYPILAIRGISDVVGFRRDDAWTAYACHCAASFAFALFRSGAADHLFVRPNPSAAGTGLTLLSVLGGVVALSLLAVAQPGATKQPEAIKQPETPVDESPKARLYVPDPQRLQAIEDAAKGMQTELRNWNELKSETERQALLKFTDRFERCPQQFVSVAPIPENGENKTFLKGIEFDFDLRRGPNARQLILRDVFVEVVNFHSVAPTFIPGAALSRKPVIAVEMRNLRTPLPWVFRAKWIADSEGGTFRRFEGEQIQITSPLWDVYRLKLLALDRGIYRFNVFVSLQQDDAPATNVCLTSAPLTVGFYSRPAETDPDFELLRKRYHDRGGTARLKFTQNSPPDE